MITISICNTFYIPAIFSSNGNVWKTMRSTTVKAFRYFGVGRESHRAKIKEEIKHVVCEMKKYQGEPFDPSDLCSISICNVMCAIVFGKRYDYQDQNLLKLMNRFHEIFRLAGGMSVINVFPFLRYLPCRSPRKPSHEMFDGRNSQFRIFARSESCKFIG